MPAQSNLNKQLGEKLGVQFKNEKVLLIALTHKSFSHEQAEGNLKNIHNEKLEFLGDAVLDLVLSEYLMEVFPDSVEGPLSKMRAHLVNESGLAEIALKLGLQDQMLMGRGEIQTQGSQKPRLLASCLEALVGACFADQGYSVAREMVRKLFAEKVAEFQVASDFDQDFKSQLQERIQAETKQTPIYEVKSVQGPAHDRRFEVKVMIGADGKTDGKEELAVGLGKSKKAAEQDAAEKGLQQLLQRIPK